MNISSIGTTNSASLIQALLQSSSSTSSSDSSSITGIEDILSISSQALYKSTQGSREPQEFQDLESALAAGNLDDAKQAYATIQEHFQQMSQSGLARSGSSELSNQIDALGEALDSGDLAAAKGAWSDLQSSFKSHAPGQGEYPPPPSQAGDSLLSSSQLEAILLAIKGNAVSGAAGSGGSSPSA